MNKRALHLYEFGPFRLNATERLLQRGNEIVPLTPKVLDTLLLLVENTGHVVEKSDLIQQLWPDSFVEESSLAQNISLLRRALAEEGSNGHYIETIPKRGYRFVADVRELDETTNGNGLVKKNGFDALSERLQASPYSAVESERGSKRRKTYLVAAVGILLLALMLVLLYRNKLSRPSPTVMPRTIAVLPFKTIGAETESDLLGLGMADALIIKLSRMSELSVLPTSSVFRFSKRDKDAVAIGQDLGVEGVLDGTVQRDGDRIRVTAQLIRVGDARTVWSGKFDERYSSIFSVQDSISDQLASSLTPEVDRSKSPAVHLTDDTEAYQSYLTGLHFWNRRTRENLPKAIAHLEQAVARDPNFALAHAILADCYYLSFQDEYGQAPPNEALARAEQSASRALELDQNLAEAHTVRAGILLSRRQFEQAGIEFRRALELKPTYAVAHLRYGYYLYWSLKLDESLQSMRRAQELDPVSPVANTALAAILLGAHDFDNSIRFSKRALELEPGTTAARLNLADAYVQKHMFTEAFRELNSIPPTDSYAFQERAYASAAAGRREEALRLLANPALSGERVGPFVRARIYGALGDKDKAFEWLEKININRVNVAALKYDPQLDPLRADVRFAEFLKRHLIQL
jgi:DNA-binding winged helix-turn-helix (wHTH) protein/TolB-like protein/Tfp pilus assembly protein PilF